MEVLLAHLECVDDSKPCLTFVPVLSIHDREGQAAEMALELFGV